MSTKMMLLALSVVTAALFALPAVALATPAHISATENFTVTPGATALGVLETESGSKIECHAGVSGSGSFTNTTAGTINLEFNNCTINSFTCTSQLAEGGTPVAGQIRTRALPFHLITGSTTNAAILITPNAGAFAEFTCAGGLILRKVIGNGVIGTIVSPHCGAAASKTAVVKFEEGATTGVQKHTTHTGLTYGLISENRSTKATEGAAETAEARLDFANAKSIVCTH